MATYQGRFAKALGKCVEDRNAGISELVRGTYRERKHVLEWLEGTTVPAGKTIKRIASALSLGDAETGHLLDEALRDRHNLAVENAAKRARRS